MGHRLTDSYEGEIGNDFSTRLEGIRIKHYMGPAAKCQEERPFTSTTVGTSSEVFIERFFAEGSSGAQLAAEVIAPGRKR
jgi:hypothetical protein